MTQHFRLLCCACSVCLIPIALVGSVTAFYIAVAINFALFHSIWLSRLPVRPNAPGVLFDRKLNGQIRLPLILFSVCGISALHFLPAAA